jgi:MFS family permease
MELHGEATAQAQMVGTEHRVTPHGWKALAGSVIVYSMDGFDLLIVSFMLTSVAADLGFTNTQAGSIITWTLMGAVAGGVIFGSASDHLGRIRILTWTILVFAVFTGFCGLARGYWDMVAYRTLAGLRLGGEFGIGMALAAEAWPASKRARVSSYVGLGWNTGVLLAALLNPVLLPIVGWQFSAVVAFVVRHTLDEPEIFVQKHASRIG